MAGPPDIRHPFGVSRLDAWVFWSLAGLWIATLVLWGLAWGSTDLPGGWWLSGAAGVIWILWGIWRQSVQTRGELVWTGGGPGIPGGWSMTLQGSGRLLSLDGIESVLDLQRALLLRVHPTHGPSRWLWLSCGDDPERWSALRRAVFATSAR